MELELPQLSGEAVTGHGYQWTGPHHAPIVAPVPCMPVATCTRIETLMKNFDISASR
ncbi:hypothetical protein DCAR_0102223 [Daucus carota subsp. sativus]|uniref:Uncharacterized protein n=1 Tax=Daucus carota subsp. sativus TaxID=79200 RepID=A0A166AIF4_DAUCS|nr:hypothetical protein DCAR_0102223 [Daucus carota subsp. sativus]